MDILTKKLIRTVIILQESTELKKKLLNFRFYFLIISFMWKKRIFMSALQECRVP